MLSKPELRFSDYKEDWIIRRLGTLVDIQSGHSPNKFELFNDGVFPFLKVEDLNNCTKYQLKSRQYANKGNGLVHKDSVIFPKRGAAILNNKIRLLKTESYMDSNLMALIPKVDLITPDFLFNIIDINQLSKIADTSTIPQINNKHIIPFKVKIPVCTKEQEKIADFLSAIDKKINLLKEKYALHEKYKKGVMQKLLSQDVRFKDESGNDFPDWQEERFSNILMLQLNSLKMSDENEYELITVRRRNGGVDSRGIYKGKDVLVKNQFELKTNQFVISKRQIVHGACGLVPEELAGAIVSNEYNVFDPVPEKLDINYFNMIATTLPMRKAFFINSDGVHIEKLLFKTKSWLKTKLDFPCVEEQRKIVCFIKSLDKKIELVLQQIEHAQTFKKGLLQQMFV